MSKCYSEPIRLHALKSVHNFLTFLKLTSTSGVDFSKRCFLSSHTDLQRDVLGQVRSTDLRRGSLSLYIRSWSSRLYRLREKFAVFCSSLHETCSVVDFKPKPCVLYYALRVFLFERELRRCEDVVLSVPWRTRFIWVAFVSMNLWWKVPRPETRRSQTGNSSGDNNSLL